MNDFDRIVYDRMGELGDPGKTFERRIPWIELSPPFRSILAATWVAMHRTTAHPLDQERAALLEALGIEDEEG